MKLLPQSPKKVLKAFLKQKPLRSEIDLFKGNLISLLDKIEIIEKRPKDESEEHLKNDLRDFLRDTYYRETNALNTKDKKDLVLHLGKSTSSEVGVIIEAKRPTNVHEMISAETPNKKALHELILYYLDERIRAGNNQLKQLVITNIHEWYIIDANYFDKHIYRNTQIRKLYDTKLGDKKDNPFFYEEILKIVSTITVDIPCVYFDIRDYNKILRNSNKEDDRHLNALQKILSPQHLLKIATPNDGNTLNEQFYRELLHIIGLEEAKENGKNIIRRKKEGRSSASLIEATIEAIKTEDVLHRIPDQSIYGQNVDEKIYNVALELCITWINRILFLKLLEGQLVTYHQDRSHRFLDCKMINDFDELFKLFHKVLAINLTDRTAAVKDKYAKVPYLNSSLFEISPLEDQTIKINALDNGGLLDLKAPTILKEVRKTTNKLPVLDYLFQFLDAYDFSSEGNEEVQEDNKTLINASVLGKVFEKINGYKDGSIFTPAFITMYMCRKSIRAAVVEKFNVALSSNGDKLFDKFEDLKNYTSRLFKTEEILKANSIINSLRICDPAVGSGHFLVSALNEIIGVKTELGLLADTDGNSISGYEIEIINDELVITDHQANVFEYRLQNGKPLNKEIQRLQKALFFEKQTIIENCLFGVDINPNSVKICRLRLWIELLKNAYYKEETGFNELETLPNIDINIKCGNSLLSRFALDADLAKALKSIKYDIAAYRGFVNDYKNEKNREVKRGLQNIIDSIKTDFRTEISKTGKDYINWYKSKGELDKLTAQFSFFEMSPKEKKKFNDNVKVTTDKVKKFETIINEIKNNAIYKNAFEWRFEFPEVLDNDGEFVGFDVIIGNPPYIQLQKLSDDMKRGFESQQYKTFAKTGDIYQLFYELGVNLLKKDGQLGYITSNKWMRTDYGSGTRRFLATQCNTTLVVDFGLLQIFDSATTYTNILFLQKANSSPTMKMCRINNKFDMNLILEEYINYSSVEIENPGSNSWIAYDKTEYALIKKIVGQGKALKEWNIKINYGLKTGYNGAFIIDTETRDRLLAEDPKSDEIIKPILRGEDIKAYVPKWAGLWLVNTHNGTKHNGLPRIDVIKDYPAVYKWLMTHQVALEKRGDKGDHWTNLRNCAYVEEFSKPKIIYPNMTKYLPFVYDKHQFFTNQKCFVITGEHLSYLTAFLNSKIFRFAFKEYFPELLGDTRELSKIFFETVTVQTVNKATDQEFEILLEKIIASKKEAKPTAHIEQELEKKLAQIYSLTEGEITLIELSESGVTRDFPNTIERSELVNS